MFKSILSSAALCLALASPAAALSVTQDVIGGDGSVIGSIRVDSAVGGVLLRVFLEKDTLTPGWHGMHFHSVGDCSDIGVFKKSMGHMGKHEGAHGLKNPRGPEFGDLPNIHVPHQHATNAEFFVPDLSLVGTVTDGSVLFDGDGSALVIHEAEDDHFSQPIGGSGARVACAALHP